jgi:hypothetical protein
MNQAESQLQKATFTPNPTGFAGFRTMLSQIDVVETKASSPTKSPAPTAEAFDIHTLVLSRTPPKVATKHTSEDLPHSLRATGTRLMTLTIKHKSRLAILFAGLALVGWLLSPSRGSIRFTPSSVPDYSASFFAGYSSQSDHAVEDPPIPAFGATLSANEIRYCLSEKIRIESWERSLNHYSQISISEFNNGIHDYNSRCGNFRYKQSTFSAVQREVESRRQSLNAEGILRASQ